MLDGDTGDAPPTAAPCRETIAVHLRKMHCLQRPCLNPKKSSSHGKLFKVSGRLSGQVAIYIYIYILYTYWYTYILNIYILIIYVYIIQWFRQRASLCGAEIGGLQGRNPPSSARPKRIGRATCRNMPRSVPVEKGIGHWQSHKMVIEWWFNGDLMVI